MGSVAQAVNDADLEEPSIAERRALIERVAASAQFRRSARLRDFLLYVGTQSLKEGCPDIHEHEIGIKVFRRPPNYDGSQDNIVRVTATDLRKRLDLYFAAEGANETLVFEIPRGGYKPVFHRRQHVPAETVQTASFATIEMAQTGSYAAEQQQPRSRRVRVSTMVLAAVCAALATACAVLLEQNLGMRRHAPSTTGQPALTAFWGGFSENLGQVDMVLPDDSVSVIEDITHSHIALDDYLSHSYMREIESSDVSADRKVDLFEISNHNLVTFGGVRAAQLIGLLLPASPKLTFARYYTADSIKQNNAILIGGKKANPWVQLFDQQTNFITDNDDQHAHGFVRNLHPKAEEQELYTAPRDPKFVGYASIAYLANPSHTGNVIILAGTDSDATSAAAEFLTSEEQLSRFRKQLGGGKFPHFEVLLKTSRLSGTALSAEMLAYRTY